MPVVLVAISILPSVVRNRTDGCLATFQTDVQFLFSLDVLNGGELNGHVARGFGVQNQRLAVGLHDRASQPVAIFQRDLVGE